MDNINKKVIRENLELRIIDFIETYSANPSDNKLSGFIKEIIKGKSFLIGSGYNKEEVEAVIKDLFVDYDNTDSYKEKNFDKFLESLFADNIKINLDSIEKHFSKFIGYKTINKTSVSKLMKVVKNSMRKELDFKNRSLNKRQNSLVKLTTNSYVQEFTGGIEAYLNTKGEDISKEDSMRSILSGLSKSLIGASKIELEGNNVKYNASKQHVPDNFAAVNDKFIIVESTINNNAEKESLPNIKHLISVIKFVEMVRKNFEKNKLQYFLSERVSRYKQLLDNKSDAEMMLKDPEQFLENHLNSNEMYKDIFGYSLAVGSNEKCIDAYGNGSDKEIRAISDKDGKIKRKNKGSSVVFPFFGSGKKEFDSVNLIVEAQLEFVKGNEVDFSDKKYVYYNNNGLFFSKVPISKINKELLINKIKDVGEKRIKEVEKQIKDIESEYKSRALTKKELSNFSLTADVINKNMASLLEMDWLSNEQAYVQFFLKSNPNPNKSLKELGVLEDGYDTYEKEDAILLIKLMKELNIEFYSNFKINAVRNNSDYNRFDSSEYSNEEFRAVIYNMATAYSIAGENVFDGYSATGQFCNEIFKMISQNSITDLWFNKKGRPSSYEDENGMIQKIRPEVYQKPRGVVKELFNNVILQRDRSNLKAIIADSLLEDKNINKEPEAVVNNLLLIKSGFVNSLLIELKTLKSEGIEDKNVLLNKMSNIFVNECNQMGVVTDITLKDFLEDEAKLIKDPDCSAVLSNQNNGIMRLVENLGIQQDNGIKRRKRLN